MPVGVLLRCTESGQHQRTGQHQQETTDGGNESDPAAGRSPQTTIPSTAPRMVSVATIADVTDTTEARCRARAPSNRPSTPAPPIAQADGSAISTVGEKLSQQPGADGEQSEAAAGQHAPAPVRTGPGWRSSAPQRRTAPPAQRHRAGRTGRPCRRRPAPAGRRSVQPPPDPAPIATTATTSGHRNRTRSSSTDNTAVTPRLEARPACTTNNGSVRSARIDNPNPQATNTRASR